MTAQWYAIERVERILRVTRTDILAMVASGKLRGRLIDGSPMISESSLEMYLASLPNKPVPETYVKVNGKVYREV
jgi:hypothetical protein